MRGSRPSRRFDLSLAGPSDDAALRHFLWECPSGDETLVAFTKEPSYFLAASVQGELVQICVARDGQEIACIGTRALRCSVVNGNPQVVGYLGDLRMRKEYRGTTLLWRIYQFLRELHRDGACAMYTTVIAEKNIQALQTIAANRLDLPVYSDLGRVITPSVDLGGVVRPAGAAFRRGSTALLPDIVAKLNDNHLQFAPRYSPQEFELEKYPGLKADDFYCLIRNGRISGVLATWDQRCFRQTVVVKYSAAVEALRQASRGLQLPATGEPLRCCYICFVLTESVDDYADLLAAALADRAAEGFTHAILALHERDPRIAVLAALPYQHYAIRLFAVAYGELPALDSRVPFFDPAFV